MAQEYRVINVEKMCERNVHWQREYKGCLIELKLKETCEYVEFVVELTDEQKFRLEEMETNFTMDDLEGYPIYADEEWNKDEDWKFIGDIPPRIQDELNWELEMLEDTIDIDGWTKVSDTGYIPQSGGLSFYKEVESES